MKFLLSNYATKGNVPLQLSVVVASCFTEIAKKKANDTFHLNTGWLSTYTDSSVIEMHLNLGLAAVIAISGSSFHCQTYFLFH